MQNIMVERLLSHIAIQSPYGVVQSYKVGLYLSLTWALTTGSELQLWGK